MKWEFSPMQLAEVSDFSFLRDWDTIRIMPEEYDKGATMPGPIECDCSGCDCGIECTPECATNTLI